VVLVSCFDTNPADPMAATTTDWAGGAGPKKKGPRSLLVFQSLPFLIVLFVLMFTHTNIKLPCAHCHVPISTPLSSLTASNFTSSFTPPPTPASLNHKPLMSASPRKRGRVGFADSVQDKPSRGDNAKRGAVGTPASYESFITGRFAGSKFAVGVSLLGIHMMVRGR
jgi:hypothetical protein